MFWIKEVLTGGEIRKHYRDISSYMGQYKLENDARLSNILTYATKRVPFYSKMPIEASLSDFPVVNKALIIDNAEEMLATGISLDDCHVASTSGSTGTPFRTLQDYSKRRRVNAEAIYWGERAGHEFGAKLYYLKVWSDRNRLTRRSLAMRNFVPVDITQMREREISRFLNALKGERGKFGIVSYASILESVAKYLSTNKTSGDESQQYQITSILGQSEPFSREAREFLQTYFKCPVTARYGLEELGIVAQQTTIDTDAYEINTASYHVEILKEESNQSAEPGEIGRIVVTDLYNHAQPMIRYDTGDLGRFWSNDGKRNHRILEEISGRKADQVYDVNDEPLAKLLMYNLWWKFPEIRQYQLIQTGRGEYQIKLNASPEFSARDKLASEFEAIVGEGAKVEVTLTDEDFILSSGKRRAVVSNYVPSRIKLNEESI